MNSTRREFLTRTMAVGALTTVVASFGKDQPKLTAKPTITPMAVRPNILYVILEDIGPNLACYGEPLVQTPNIDRFADKGVRFTNAFCIAPVCSVSRSGIMTGCFPMFFGAHHHRTFENHKASLPAPIAHLCDWFREGGYYTCNLKPEKPHSSCNGSLGSGKIDLNFSIENPRKGDPFDGRDWSQRMPDQPFFAHITIMETHKGPGWKIARRQPKSELVDPDRLKLPPYYPDHSVARDEYANYLDAIHLSDGYLGQLLARLEKEGLDKNTIVVVSSDHGPLFRGKQFVYDNGLRIPLIIRFPDGRGANTVDERLVSGVDIAPTLLGLAGITPPENAMHGINVLSSQRRTYVFAERDRMDESIDRMRVVRTERYKYIRNYLPGTPYMQRNAYKEKDYPTWNLVKQLHKEGKLTPEADLFAAEEKPIEELYDLATDPHELKNLAATIDHATILKQLRGLVDQWVTSYDRGNAYEDPVDIFQGLYRHLPEDKPAAKS